MPDMKPMKRTPDKKKVAVVADGYKVEAFRRALHDAGYEFEEAVGPLLGSVCFYVVTDNPQALAYVTRKADRAAKLALKEDGGKVVAELPICAYNRKLRRRFGVK